MTGMTRQALIKYKSSQPKKKARLGTYQRQSFVPRSVITQGGLFPKRKQGVLRYAETFSIALNANGLGSYVFTCNGLFNPDISGTSAQKHQPFYFDQMMAIYNHYAVKSSKFKVQCTGISPLPAAAINCTIMVDDDANPNVGSTPYVAIEREKSVTWSIFPTNQMEAISRWQSWDAKTYFGYSDPVSNPTIGGDSTTNPAEQSFYIVFVDGGTAAASKTVQFQAYIEYDAIFYELASTPPS